MYCIFSSIQNACKSHKGKDLKIFWGNSYIYIRIILHLNSTFSMKTFKKSIKKTSNVKHPDPCNWITTTKSSAVLTRLPVSEESHICAKVQVQVRKQEQSCGMTYVVNYGISNMYGRLSNPASLLVSFSCCLLN